MNTKARNGQAGMLEELWTTSGFVIDYTWFQTQPQFRKSFIDDLKTVSSLSRTTESLVFAYLAANLKSKNIPLKEFMDGFEEKILLACLRLTYSNQKNAAALLKLKPTTLCEKMRKLGINGRRMKLSRKMNLAHLPEKQKKMGKDEMD
jgi:hypothetical protein